jgi:glycine oxidase
MGAPDVIIIGGGVIGCGLAWELGRAKLSVTVIERHRPGEEASGAAAGMLAPTSEAVEAPAMVSLATSSAALYPSWVAQLADQTSIDVGYRREGTLLVATSEAEAEAWRHLPGEFMRGTEVRELEPALSAQIQAAFYLPSDHQVDNRRLMQALLKVVNQSGGEVLSGLPVSQLMTAGGRATGVTLADGTPLAGGAVVNAAGCWAGQLAAVGPRLSPTRPIRGQMVMLKDTAISGRPLVRHVVRSPRAYIVPRAGGNLLIGSTTEDAGYEKKVTARGIAGLLAGGMEMAPELRRLPFVEAWAGLRPDSPDHLPILGATDLENYFVATGHFRNGILLAPITAKLVAEVILGQSPSLELEPFSPLRFLGRDS